MSDADPTRTPQPSEPGSGPERLVQSRLTEEQLNNLWDRLQGTANRDGKPVPAYGWGDLIQDLWTTVRVTRAVHRLGAGLAVLATIAVCVLVLREGAVRIHTPSAWQTAGVRLPDELSLRLGRSEAQLEAPSFALLGKFGGAPRKGSNLTSIDVTFSGKAPTGEALIFRGTLLLTNAPGVTEIRRRKDFTGALLSGDWIVGTNAAVQVEGQPYLP